MTTVRKIGHRHQRTIARPVELEGVGFVTGATVRLSFQPAPPSTGVVFVRTDLDSPVRIPACLSQVTGTKRRTVLGRAPAQVELVEHVLAALSGLRIDNCYVELDAPEPPGLDGSAWRFVNALQQAGIVLQAARRAIWTVDTPVVVSSNGATIALHPSEQDEFKISYTLDYGNQSAIGRQCHTQVLTPDCFVNDLAASRTYIFEEEAAELRRQGIGSRTTAADLLVFGPHGPINNRLRYSNEPARHKVLDVVGDLSLLGHDLRGHVVAYRSGHAMNVALVRILTQKMNHSHQTCFCRMAA